MPVIVFEGPDESGKTVFASVVKEALDPLLQPDLDRSPVKHHGWSSNYSHYLNDTVFHFQGSLAIRDRTPEISETIYGTLRGHPRGFGYTYESYNWFSSPIFMVFCKGPEMLEKSHLDVEGNLIGTDQWIVNALYDLVYFDLRMSWLRGGGSRFRIIQYNREDPTSWLHVMWMLREWLTMELPDHESEIRQSLSYSIDSQFPLPQES